MGWLRLNKALEYPLHLFSGYSNTDPSKGEPDASHIEDITIQEYPFQPIDVPDTLLPTIPADIVRATKQNSDRLWIVVDNIVFDCTNYVHDHPGGSTVIESFCGENCSWQFWRFHNKALMQDFGRPLRIGRTHGIANRFKERPRFVGLKKIGNDEDW